MFRSRIGNRSESQKKDDEAFMAALREIDTLEAKDGHVSMDSSDLEQQLKELHESGQKLVKG
ncbi:hypothetical protein [Pseudomonas sp. p106]|uniref:hypothetical protein n=1 Tax=Pseudomonas sp. p106 TaxID=2479854 RepID=UPI000F7A6570|nr:hypothetical protein [Pseudomonas sp. p106]RRV45796.1 hypothetical protein EGJ09_12285 [Pseudomonas sp. p106]